MVTHFKENPDPFGKLLLGIDLLQGDDLDVALRTIQSAANFFSCPVRQESGEGRDLNEATISSIDADCISKAFLLEAVEIFGDP